MVRKWLRRLFEGARPEALWGRHGPRLFARAGFHPALEVLERRDLLAAFTPGDLVIYRVGTGTGSLGSSGTAVFLDEYTPTGSLVQSIALPTTASGYNNPLVGSGTATSEGLLTDSANGQYLVLTGYAAGVGTASVASTPSASTPRTVGLVDASGFINTSTALNNVADGNNVRSAVSSNGLQIWVGGAGGSSSPGVGFATLGSTLATQGSTAATQLSTTVTNVRQVNIFNGQLYLSSQAGSTIRIATVGTGEPTTAGQTVTNLPGLGTSPVPNGFFFAHLNGAGSAVDTLYVADDTTGGGRIEKFSLVSGSWVATGFISAPLVRGLTGVVNGTTVSLYATTSGSAGTTGTLFGFTDTTGYNGTVSGTAATLATAASNEAFRGVALAPVAPASTPDLTVGVSGPPTAAVGISYPYTLTVANSGTASASGVTVQFTLPSGLTYGSASGTNGFTAAQSGGVVTFSGGSLTAGASATLTVNVSPTAIGTITVPAAAAKADPANAIAETSEINNASPTAVNTSVLSTLPDLTVGLSAPTVAVFGTPFNYTLTAANSGTSAASGVTVKFTLPAGLTYGSASGSNGFTAVQSGGVVTFSGGSLAASSSATLTVTVTAPLPNPAPTLPVNFTAPVGAAVIDPANTITEGNESNNSSPIAVTTSVRTTALPQATADSYTVAAGGTLTIGAANGILANDTGSPLTIISPLTTNTPQTALPAGYVAASGTQTPLSFTSPYTVPTTKGGTVTLNPDGSFTYKPKPGFTGIDSLSYTVSDAVQNYKTDLPVLASFNGVPLTAGGYGSSLYPKPGSTTEFYGLEDRGPNATAANGNIVEPLPNYDPAIGLFKFVNGQAILEQYIPLKAANGTPYSGRVNSQNPTGETLVDLNGNVQPQDPNGYDSEGLVALPDGTFWVSDEYGPFITHFDATGKQIARLSPLDGSLPVELQNRVINRGMEGLTITPDGNTLVGIMQSALQQPDIGSLNAKQIAITRIVTYQLVTANGVPAGTEHEYLYLLDNPKTNATAVSEITALDSTHFLVDERDGNFPPGAYKKFWEIDISNATDVGPNSPLIGTTPPGGVVAYDSSSTHMGLTIGGKSLEEFLGTVPTATAIQMLTTNGITPSAKGTTPYLDLGALLDQLAPQGTFFGHDKIEGVAAINGGLQLVISNDSDFDVGGVTGLGSGGGAPYQLNAKTNSEGVLDDGEYLIVNLARLPAVGSTATVTFTVLASVSAQTQRTATGAAVNHATGNYTSTLTVKNTSSSAIPGGFLIQLTNLTAGVTLTAATITVGTKTYTLTVTQGANGPTVLVPTAVMSSLASGQSLMIALQFSNPQKQSITFGAEVYSDPLDLL